MSRSAVLNAFDETMIAELDAVFTQLSDDPAVRVIVLAGDVKHFSADAHLQRIQRACTALREWSLDLLENWCARFWTACLYRSISRIGQCIQRRL